MPQVGIYPWSKAMPHDHSTINLGGAVPLTSITGHTKVPHDALAINADQVDGEEAAAIVTNARVKAHFPDTIANILSNHTKAVHDALAILHSSTGGRTANDHHPQSHTLASHSTKAHGELTGIGADQHHNQSHRDDHYAGAGDQIAGQSLAQLRSTDSPSFAQVNTPTVQGNASLYLEAGASGVRSVTIWNDTTVSACNLRSHDATGIIMRSTAGARKYKDKITDLELDTSLIYNLRPISFNSKCLHDDKKKRFVGLIADEVEGIVPSAVEYNLENEPEAIDYQMIQMLMLKEMQKLNERLSLLEN